MITQEIRGFLWYELKIIVLETTIGLLQSKPADEKNNKETAKKVLRR